MDWSFESLWRKARTYIRLAVASPRESAQCGLAYVFAIDFLARAVLARVHPSLLADAKMPEAIEYACGLGEVDDPKSIGSLLAFHRCQRVVKNLTDDDKKHFDFLLWLRNSELHSGYPAFEDYPPDSWLADYYRITKKLIDHLQKSFRSFVGTEEYKTASSILAKARKETVNRAKKAVGTSADAFSKLTPDEKATRLVEAERRSVAWGEKLVTCPACRYSRCTIQGEDKSYGPFRLDEDRNLEQDVTFIPVSLHCTACGLSLSGLEELQVVDLDHPFSRTRYDSPIDFYADEIRDYYSD